MRGKRPPLDEQKSLFEATVAREGITTGAGNVGGTSFIDAGLAGAGANSFVSMLAVIFPGQPLLVDSRDITAFNNATGEVTAASAFKGGQVAAGVPYKIVTFRFVPAEVAALQADVTALLADVGDASGATLGSILGILGDPAQTFLAMIGYEGAAALANKLTAQRALNLDLFDLTTFEQEAVAATDVNGTTWKDLLDKSTITKPTKICGFTVTVAGTWAGKAQVSITDGAGTKIFPFQDQYEEDTEFTSGTQVVFNFLVVVPVADGYKFQFRSSNGADGAGETLQLNNLDVIEVG